MRYRYRYQVRYLEPDTWYLTFVPGRRARFSVRAAARAAVVSESQEQRLLSRSFRRWMMLLLVSLLVRAAASSYSFTASSRRLADSNIDDTNLTALLPLWSPLTQWERINGPSYRELWRLLPLVPGVYRQSLSAREVGGSRNSSGKADCNALAAVPSNATAVIWSGIGVALRHFAAHAGCEALLTTLERRATIVAFEPVFNGASVHSTASCPRIQSPSSGGNAYVIVPYPTQFHARSDASITDHIASVTRVRRPHLAAYFASSHGRQAELRAKLHTACREVGETICDRIDFAEGRCDPRHQAGNGASSCRGESAADVGVSIFERILRGYLRSEFCLMPGGDTPTRQGIMDALIVGCIPVFFADCTQQLLYDEAYHPFIPRYSRAGWGAGSWSVLLSSVRILKNPHLFITELEAISPKKRAEMRGYISTFISKLQYTVPGVALHEYQDAQAVYEAVAPRLEEKRARLYGTNSKYGVTAKYALSQPSHAAQLSASNVEVVESILKNRSNSSRAKQTANLMTRCDEEKSFELARDRQLAKLTSLPTPFPLDEGFPITLETPQHCMQLLQGLDVVQPRVLVAIESYKQIGLVRRVVQRLSHERSIGFLLHLAADVSVEHTVAARELASNTPDVCVLRSGYVVYRTSTDMRILFGMWRWLLHESTGWDFFISLSGADYPAVNGAKLIQLLQRMGNVSWRLPERGMLAGELNRSSAWPVPGLRFREYGLGCEATRNYTRVRGRTNWLARLVPAMSPRWTYPYSSGGIFHRNTIHFLVNDDRARAAYMFFRLFPVAGVEHYWATVYTLPDMAPFLTNVTLTSCHMQWRDSGGGGGRLDMRKVNQSTAHNTFLDISQWSNIEQEITRCTPFLRKFDEVKEREVLDRIDASSESLARHCDM